MITRKQKADGWRRYRREYGHGLTRAIWLHEKRLQQYEREVGLLIIRLVDGMYRPAPPKDQDA